MKVVTAEQMRQIDRRCIEQGTPASVLMENAGKAVAMATREHLGSVVGVNIVAFAGGGNNGGDALVAARYLHDRGARVTVCLCSRRPDNDENLRWLYKKGVTCIDAFSEGIESIKEPLSEADGIIDGLLGTGRMRPLQGLFRDIMETVKTERSNRGCSVIAVDLPTGMDADTGACDTACCPADLTVTMGFPKPGLFGHPGADYTGRLIVADIGIPSELASMSPIDLMDDNLARELLPLRPRTANKGTFGKLLVVAGSVNYTGAATLACRGALQTGTGLVTLATAASLHPVVAAGTPEITHLPLSESPPGYIGAESSKLFNNNHQAYDALLVGCGLSRNPATAEFVRTVVAQCGEKPLVLDADSLNILSEVPDWYTRIPGNTVITPHPGEMSRLSRRSIPELQQDRFTAAISHAAAWNTVIVLKGACTVVASPNGRCRISPFANPGLASGGTGDVLGGIIAGLVAQGLEPFDAASLGVYLHGAAGERLRETMGETGMLASDLPAELPRVIQHLRKKPDNR